MEILFYRFVLQVHKSYINSGYNIPKIQYYVIIEEVAHTFVTLQVPYYFLLYIIN